MAVYQLDKNYVAFPDPHGGNPNGLIAIGGDLTVEWLLLAYSNGIFPWFAYKVSPVIKWYCPLDRFVIFPEKIHVSHSMRTLMNQHVYQVTFNSDFNGVIHECSKVNGRDHNIGAWLGHRMIAAYVELHRQGYAASVEVWQGDKLVGGLYGVTIGKSFFGESMFSLRPSASKLALISLAQLMQAHGGNLIDCQFETPHLKSMGGEHISYDRYMQIISETD